MSFILSTSRTSFTVFSGSSPRTTTFSVPDHRLGAQVRGLGTGGRCYEARSLDEEEPGQWLGLAYFL